MASMGLIKLGRPAVRPLVTACATSRCDLVQGIDLLGQIATPDQIELVDSLRDDTSNEILDEAISLIRERAK